jgi:predicted TIM-barrel fold metal-dependent hydrolase
VKDGNRKDGIDRRSFLGIAGAGVLGTIASGIASSAEQKAERPRKRFRVIDAHFHTFNSKLQGSNGIPFYYKDSTIEYELSLMDRGGVDKAFLITYNAEDVAAEMRSRGYSPVALKPVANHEYQVAAWQAHKDRFWYFPDGVNPLHEDYLQDLERNFDLGASGVKLLPMFHGLLPDNPAWLPVYELCQRRSKPVIIDWSWWIIGDTELTRAWNESVGYGFNESKERQELCKSYKSMADWVKPMDPIFDKFSNLQISLAHIGTPRGREDYEHIFAFIARHPNAHCDLAGTPREWNPQFIEQLVKAVGPRRVMYGTDMPYWTQGPDSYLTGNPRWGVIADDCSFLSDTEKQLILADNAERFVRNEA